MPLFPVEEGTQPAGAPERMRYFREQGTKKLLLLMLLIGAVWYITGQIQDHYLLAHKWPPLQPDLSGLTVVGTLNRHSNFDQSDFKILTENTAARVALTEYGWDSIFNTANGPLCTLETGNAIQTALNVNDIEGEAMLAPFVRAETQVLMAHRHQGGDPAAFSKIDPNQVIHLPVETLHGKPSVTTLNALIKKYSGGGPGAMNGGGEASGGSAGGSASGRQVEHLVFLSPGMVASIFPVVLTGAQFTSASIDEEPPNLITGPEYSVSLNLTPQGRSRFFQWSHAHQDEDVVFVLNHQIVTKGHISEVLDTNSWSILNIQDKQAAEALTSWVNQHGAKNH